MINFQHDQITDLLHKNVCEVTFTKVNGEERVMLCTLNNNYLPNQTDLEEQIQRVRKQSDSVISVWDIKSEGWRSFRIDSIKQFNITYKIEGTT